MSLVWIIYLIDVICDSHLIGFLGFIGAVLWCFGFVGSCIAKNRPDDDEAQTYLRFYESMLTFKIVVSLFIILAFLIPSKDTAYKMLAAYGVETIVANEDVQRMGSKSLQIIEKAMDNYLKEEDNKSVDKK
jgi:hypothetical protein